jgi:hypothetical protein
MEKQTVTAHMKQLCFEATGLSKGVTKMKMTYRKEECLPMRTVWVANSYNHGAVET